MRPATVIPTDICSFNDGPPTGRSMSVFFVFVIHYRSDTIAFVRPTASFVIENVKSQSEYCERFPLCVYLYIIHGRQAAHLYCSNHRRRRLLYRAIILSGTSGVRIHTNIRTACTSCTVPFNLILIANFQNFTPTPYETDIVNF